MCVGRELGSIFWIKLFPRSSSTNESNKCKSGYSTKSHYLKFNFYNYFGSMSGSILFIYLFSERSISTNESN